MTTGDAYVAYILLVHKNPEQVNLLIKQILMDEKADIYIHIDKKSYDSMISKILGHPRVKILGECIDTLWGDISLVDATNLLLREVVNSEKKYDFVCLRSGQDLVVKEGYSAYLSKNKGKSFMTALKIDKSSSYASCLYVKWPKCTRRLYDSIHPYRVLRSVIKRIYGLGINLIPNKNALPDNFILYDGSQWFCISMDLAKYIVHYLNENPWYYKAFENSLAPDTFFYQTLVKNSPFAETVININHVYMRWGKKLKDINHPVFLTIEDIETIENTDNYFARKFDWNIDNKVIRYFYEKIKNRGDCKDKVI